MWKVLHTVWYLKTYTIIQTGVNGYNLDEYKTFLPHIFAPKEHKVTHNLVKSVTSFFHSLLAWRHTKRVTREKGTKTKGCSHMIWAKNYGLYAPPPCRHKFKLMYGFFFTKELFVWERWPFKNVSEYKMAQMLHTKEHNKLVSAYYSYLVGL